MSKSDASQGRYYNIGGGQYILTSDIDGSDGAEIVALTKTLTGQMVIFGIALAGFTNGKLV